MKKIIPFLKSEFFWLVLIMVLGAFLRFWQLQEWQHLSFDQARDYLIVKRIIMDHKFTLVGPTVSIAPGFFLPPFYYYSLIPFLILSHFHIIGPDIYTAVFGVAAIGIFYLAARDLFGKFPALVSSFAFAVNPYLIQTSRHAWNPNTLVFYILVFFLALERFWLNKKRKYLLLASFSLSWAIGLHLTAVVFLPLLALALIKDFKERGIGKINLLSLALFGLPFLPLLFFDLRHAFPISKAGLAYLGKQGDGSWSRTLTDRLGYFLKDFIQVPSVLLSGIFQKQNLTVRPSNITAFKDIRLWVLENLGLEKLLLALGLFAASLLTLVKRFSSAKVKLLLACLFLGFSVRFLFPPQSFYFYYFLSLFPFIFLALAGLVYFLSQRRGKLPAAMAIAGLALWSLSGGLKTEAKPEKYFLPACEVIARDFKAGEKAALAINVADRTRWEHTGHEYRYFLEAMYGFPMTGWEGDDYRKADILYLVDEGELKDPLSLRGMEMEAFRPEKIEKSWQVPTGQKIYKLVKN